MQPSISHPHKPNLSKNYICPCGKAYLSYPALYTHIKQKHEGKAPGEIQKPQPAGRGRGRPPKNTQDQGNKIKESLSTRQTMISLPNIGQENSTYRIHFQKIFDYLQGIIYHQEISSRIWEQAYSFRKFEEYIDSSANKNVDKSERVSVGQGLGQFLKDVSTNAEPQKFEQVLILFMLLLQYVLDESNDQLVIEKWPVDSIIEYMNPFINSHICDYSQFLGIKGLWVMQSSHIHQLFMCFYNWLKWRDYTGYCITLID